MVSLDADLVIVGGGPAGIATALFLSHASPRLRERIVVLEKETYPREKICAGAIGGRADRLLASIGVRVDVPSVPILGLSVATSRGRLAASDPAPSEPIGRVVRRLEFDAAFAAEARSRGLRIDEGARVTGLERAASHVLLRSSRGDLRARAVVGADGVGSFIRRALGLAKGRWLAQVVEVDTPAVPSDPARHLLHFDLEDASFPGYGWDFPTLVKGEPLVCRGLYELRSLASAEPVIDLGERLLRRLALLGLSTNVKLKRFSERGLSLHEPVALPRALLVGEAAGIDPVLGEGIAQAIFYGHTAGRYLARCLDANDLSFLDWQGELRRSRVGFDLRARARAIPLVYGRGRPALERWVVSSPSLARSGLRYFAGDHVPRAPLARSLVDLGRAALVERLS